MPTTYNGREVWRILYDAVMQTPEVISFHLGLVFILKAGWKSLVQWLFFKKRVEKEQIGGELLTRCAESVLPKQYIGAAFSEMPMCWMKKMFPVLLELQLRFIADLEKKEGEFYSINLESLDGDWEVWSRVFLLLKNWAKLPIRLEIKENAFLSSEVMHGLAKLCAETGMGIYIDDLCSACHELPAGEEYVAKMIEILYPHIRAVKVDYVIMQKILEPEVLCSVKANLECFRRLWKSKCKIRLPIVIFESMPEENYYWARLLGKLVSGYKGYLFQLG